MTRPQNVFQPLQSLAVNIVGGGQCVSVTVLKSPSYPRDGANYSWFMCYLRRGLLASLGMSLPYFVS